jgi:hypothetical protein
MLRDARAPTAPPTAGQAKALLAPWSRPSAGTTDHHPQAHPATMTTKRPDLYATLGVPPSATQAEISRAYRALLRRHHPDTRAADDESQNAASDTTLQQILAAYTVLHDPALRADYDREARLRTSAVRRKPQQAPDDYRAHGQPPIVAGPVRWHRVPDPPAP